MATPNIVPRADQEGGLGTAAKSWGKLFINQAASQSTPAFTLENSTVDQIALDIDASNTTANVIDINAQPLTTGDAVYIDANSLTTGSAIGIDIDDALTTSSTKSLIEIDYDKSGVTASSQTSKTIGLDIQLHDAATNNASGITQHEGVKVLIDAASTTGTIRQTAFQAYCSDGDPATSMGYYSNIEDGGIDFKAVSSAATVDYFTIATTTNGATTLTTVDDDATAAHFEIAADGNITLGSAAVTSLVAAQAIVSETGLGVFTFRKTGNTADYLGLSIGTHGDTTFTTVDASATAAHFEIAADGNITLDSAALTNIESVGLIKLDGEAGVEIENGAAAAALLIDNDTVDQIALDIDAANTTANIIDIDATALTSGKAIHIDAANGGQALIHIDKDDTSTGDVNGTNGLLNVEYAKSGVTGDGNSNNHHGINIVVLDSATNHANSTVGLTAIKAAVDFANSTGTTSATGLELIVTDAAVNTGIDLTCEDGGTDLVFKSSADAGDTFSIMTTTHGATTLKTTDDDASAAHIIFEADGNVDVNGLTITLDAATGIELEGATNVTGDLDVSAEATVASLVCTAGGTFGGGFGATGTTISTAGVGQFDGALTTGAALTADNIVCTNAATFGGGTGSTGVTISTAGVVTADGLISSTASGVTGINYRTLWIDAGSMVPQVTNGAAAGTSESADAYDVMNDFYAFDADTIEFTQYKLAMPLQWDGGTIKAKFYWKPSSSTTTSHSVQWGIDGQAHADGGELGAWGTTVSVTADDVIGTDSTKKVHTSVASGAVTIAGSPAAGASELVYLRFQRVASHATDDLNEDAHLLGVAIQYQETAALQSAW